MWIFLLSVIFYLGSLLFEWMDERFFSFAFSDVKQGFSRRGPRRTKAF
jgi:hypothetical protein